MAGRAQVTVRNAPAALCGLFGMKPQRDRISLAPMREHWHGLSVTGSLARSVADSALWLDVCHGGVNGGPPPPEHTFSQAARTKPGRLRIAYSTKAPRAIAPAVVSAEVKAAVEQTADLLRSLDQSLEDVKAIVFRVSSPGGSDTASDQILAAVMAAKAAGIEYPDLLQRIVELALWTFFAIRRDADGNNLVPHWVPLIIIARTVLTDFIRSAAFGEGKTAFGPDSMQVSRWAKELTASRWSRIGSGYGWPSKRMPNMS